jgi:hypothetical protein
VVNKEELETSLEDHEREREMIGTEMYREKKIKCMYIYKERRVR